MPAHMTRWFAAVLLLALTPSFAYVGHWEPRFDIPFTDYYWGIPEAWGHNHTHDANSHGQHCHGDSSCSEGPVTAGAAVALLGEETEMIGMAALLLLVLAALVTPSVAGALSPETPPPRGRLVLAR